MKLYASVLGLTFAQLRGQVLADSDYVPIPKIKVSIFGKYRWLLNNKVYSKCIKSEGNPCINRRGGRKCDFYADRTSDPPKEKRMGQNCRKCYTEDETLKQCWEEFNTAPVEETINLDEDRRHRIFSAGDGKPKESDSGIRNLRQPTGVNAIKSILEHNPSRFPGNNNMMPSAGVNSFLWGGNSSPLNNLADEPQVEKPEPTMKQKIVKCTLEKCAHKPIACRAKGLWCVRCMKRDCNRNAILKRENEDKKGRSLSSNSQRNNQVSSILNATPALGAIQNSGMGGLGRFPFRGPGGFRNPSSSSTDSTSSIRDKIIGRSFRPLPPGVNSDASSRLPGYAPSQPSAGSLPPIRGLVNSNGQMSKAGSGGMMSVDHQTKYREASITIKKFERLGISKLGDVPANSDTKARRNWRHKKKQVERKAVKAKCYLNAVNICNNSVKKGRGYFGTGTMGSTIKNCENIYDLMSIKSVLFRSNDMKTFQSEAGFQNCMKCVVQEWEKLKECPKREE